MEIVRRPANNETEAEEIAQQMEDVGLIVFSITYTGVNLYRLLFDRQPQFIVWGKRVK